MEGRLLVLDIVDKKPKGDEEREGEIHWVPVLPIPRHITSRGTVLLLVAIPKQLLVFLFNEIRFWDFERLRLGLTFHRFQRLPRKLLYAYKKAQKGRCC